MPKFKVGDRVQVLRGDYAGLIGTVAEDHSSPWIHFEKKSGFEAPVPQFNIPAGHAGCIVESDAVLIGENIHLSISNFALRVIESGLLDAEACKVVASFALELTGDDNV